MARSGTSGLRRALTSVLANLKYQTWGAEKFAFLFRTWRRKSIPETLLLSREELGLLDGSPSIQFLKKFLRPSAIYSLEVVVSSP